MQTEQWINSRCACAQLLMDRSDAEHHALIYTHIDCESQDIDHRYKQLIVYSMARPQRCESAYHTSFRAMIMQCAFQSDHHNPIQHHCRYRIDVVTRRISCCIHTPRPMSTLIRRNCIPAITAREITLTMASS